MGIVDDISLKVIDVENIEQEKSNESCYFTNVMSINSI